jgi:hypothetical protein
VTDKTEIRSPSISSLLEVDATEEIPSDPFMLGKALLGLLFFDIFGLGRSFEELLRFVRSYKVVPRAASAQTVVQVCNGINYASVWYPKRVLCLQRSVVTTCLLRRSGVPAEMVLGAQHLPFKAHAWTEVDHHPINERKDVQKIYAVLERC